MKDNRPVILFCSCPGQTIPFCVAWICNTAPVTEVTLLSAPLLPAYRRVYEASTFATVATSARSATCVLCLEIVSECNVRVACTRSQIQDISELNIGLRSERLAFSGG